MKKFLSVCGIFAALSLSSCATIFTGTKQPISFNSTPSNATVSINGATECTTPCVVRVKRSLGSRMVQVSKDGYQAQTFKLEKKFNLVTLVNIPLSLLYGGGLIVGGGIDCITGAVVKYRQDSYFVQLKLPTGTIADTTHSVNSYNVR